MLLHSWPSGLRRYVQVVVFSEAWVRILPDALCGKKNIFFCLPHMGARRELNPRPLAPEARIIPLDHWPLQSCMQTVNIIGELGLVGYDVCLTRRRSRVRFSELVWKKYFFFPQPCPPPHTHCTYYHYCCPAIWRSGSALGS